MGFVALEPTELSRAWLSSCSVGSVYTTNVLSNKPINLIFLVLGKSSLLQEIFISWAESCICLPNYGVQGIILCNQVPTARLTGVYGYILSIAAAHSQDGSLYTSLPPNPRPPPADMAQDGAPDYYTLVSGFYGPGDLACWYFSIASCIFNSLTAKRDEKSRLFGLNRVCRTDGISHHRDRPSAHPNQWISCRLWGIPYPKLSIVPRELWQRGASAVRFPRRLTSRYSRGIVPPDSGNESGSENSGFVLLCLRRDTIIWLINTDEAQARHEKCSLRGWTCVVLRGENRLDG